MIDYGKFERSLLRLEEQLENRRLGNPALSPLDREGVAESVIQRFEICHDCLWKLLKRHLTEVLGLAETPNSPKPIFRLAHENHLLDGSLVRWMRFAEARMDTSHDCNAEKAEACLNLVPKFLEDAVRLYQTMTGATWKQTDSSTSLPKNGR